MAYGLRDSCMLGLGPGAIWGECEDSRKAGSGQALSLAHSLEEYISLMGTLRPGGWVSHPEPITVNQKRCGDYSDSLKAAKRFLK